MSEYVKLYEFDKSWNATRVTINRSGREGPLSFSALFERNDEKIELQFQHPDNINNIVELIDIEHVLISQEINSQREFGTVRLEFLGECYSELWCDSIVELLNNTESKLHGKKQPY